jgi:hypothetical protein
MDPVTYSHSYFDLIRVASGMGYRQIADLRRPFGKQPRARFDELPMNPTDVFTLEGGGADHSGIVNVGRLLDQFLLDLSTPSPVIDKAELNTLYGAADAMDNFLRDTHVNIKRDRTFMDMQQFMRVGKKIYPAGNLDSSPLQYWSKRGFRPEHVPERWQATSATLPPNLQDQMQLQFSGETVSGTYVARHPGRFGVHPEFFKLHGSFNGFYLKASLFVPHLPHPHGRVNLELTVDDHGYKLEGPVIGAHPRAYSYTFRRI